MIQTATSTLSDRSRLVRLLSELSAIKFSASEHNLAEQLGRLIGLSDSISLARSLGQLPLKAGDPSVENAGAVRDDLLASRREMMRIIVESFAPQAGSTGIQAPSLSVGTRIEALQTFEPYRRFYSMHQAEMAGAIQSLRQRVRNGVAGFSVELNQLAELDRILGESLSIHTGKLFNLCPKLLEERFKQLLQAHRDSSAETNVTEPHQWLMPGGWLELFYQDMKELLLAELDVRLQPVFGLLEALDEQTRNTTP